MFNTKCLLLCLLSLLALELRASNVPFIELCKPDDTACLISSAQAAVPYLSEGVPSLGIEPADPLNVDIMTYKEANLEINFKNSVITGPKNCKILNLEHHAAEQEFKVEIETPLTIKGEYDVRGKMFLIDAIGDGKFEIQTDKIVLTITMKYKIIEKNGHKYWKCSKVDYSYDLVEKVHLKFENLFGGNEAAAKPLQELLDNGWKEVITTLGAPIIDKVVAEYSKIVDELFKNLEVDEVA